MGIAELDEPQPQSIKIEDKEDDYGLLMEDQEFNNLFVSDD